MTPFQMTKLGQLMTPEPGNAMEVEGVLNPAAVRGRDGQLYLFPRMVGRGNFSRIGIVRVLFDEKGDPRGVERQGIALEPETDYELRPDGSGGCEDPRITYVEPLGHYVMAYTALTPKGPRIALARSEDLFHWERLGLATFEPYESLEFNGIPNKDAALFPLSIPDPDGKPALALLHRPLFPGTRPEEKVRAPDSEECDIHRESIWVSYRDMHIEGGDADALSHFTSHHRLASPEAPWSHLKIGTGCPPLMTPLGWLLIYHGVSEMPDSLYLSHPLRYAAGVMVLSKDSPQTILYRSPDPVLSPELPEERIGTVGDVVFPTGIDRRDDLGTPNRIDVYYGMADDRIGVARMDVPDRLPE